ncbi:MAG: tetratricopeptide repeat protein, partial [Rhodothermales bacterium]
EWETSESNFERAIVNNPSNAKAHYFYAQYCLIVGRFEEAIQEMRRALQLDPLSPLYNTQLGGVFLNAGRLDEAIAQLRLTLNLFPDEALAHEYLGLAYLQKGMFAPGITEIQKRNSLMWWVDPDLSLELAYAFAVSGKHEEARRILNNVLKGSGQRTVSMSGIASVYTALGDKEAAIAWLQKAVKQHEGETLWIKTDPTWDSLRSDSRFQALLKKMDLD